MDLKRGELVVGIKIDSIMHKEQKKFIKSIRKIYPKYFMFKDVLDVGSRDINGSNRFLFWFCRYEGIDVVGGKNVDVTTLAHEYNPNKKYDVVISTEMLEHDEYWLQSLKVMYMLLKPGGLLLITAAGKNRDKHMSDYYKNITREMLIQGLEPDKYFGIYGIIENAIPSDIYFFGIKGYKKTAVNGYDRKS